MPERLLRTFISISVPKQVITVQEMLKTTVSSKPDGVKWVRSNSVHITLKFNGPTPADLIPKMNADLKSAVSRFAPIKLSIAGTGCFPNRDYPRVLWLGVDGETEQLQLLVNEIHSVMGNLGYPDESDQFKPHVTIARLPSKQKQTPDIDTFLKSRFEPVAMFTDRIHVISSELLPGGPVYSNLGTHYFSPQPEKE